MTTKLLNSFPVLLLCKNILLVCGFEFRCLLQRFVFSFPNNSYLTWDAESKTIVQQKQASLHVGLVYAWVWVKFVLFWPKFPNGFGRKAVNFALVFAIIGFEEWENVKFRIFFSRFFFLGCLSMLDNRDTFRVLRWFECFWPLESNNFVVLLKMVKN